MRRATFWVLCTAIALVTGTTAAQGPPAGAGKTASLAVQFGSLGLYNLDNEFTKASPMFGATPAFDLEVGEIVSVGGELVLMWPKSELAERPRLVLSPHLRTRLSFPWLERLWVDVVLAAGLTIWPEDYSEQELDPALNPTRLGWSVRGAAGLRYELSDLWSCFGSIGYYATSTFGQDLPATIDGMIISVGPSARF